MNLINASMPAAQDLVGCWYFDSYWDNWSQILGTEGRFWWVVRGEDGKTRAHCTGLEREGLSPERITKGECIRETLDLIRQLRRDRGWTF